MHFYPVVNVCSFTHIIGKGLAVFGISLLYFAVAIISASLAVETICGGLSMYASCPGENPGFFVTFF